MLLFGILAFLAAYFVALRPLLAAYGYTRPTRLYPRPDAPARYGHAYESVRLRARDGVLLDGWYIPSSNGAAVLLLHRQGTNRIGVLRHADALATAGYGVLLLDLRRHGSSGGQLFGRSQIERDDVLTAVTYLNQRRDLHLGGIGVFGQGIGGLFALHAAAQTVAIRAVAVDSPGPASMADLPPPRRLRDRLLNYPLQRAYLALIARFSKMPLLPATDTILPRLRQPLFIISAGHRLEQAVAHQVYAAASEPKLLWELRSHGYVSSWQAQPQTYAARLVRFFDHALPRKVGDGWTAPNWESKPDLPSYDQIQTPFGNAMYEVTMSGAQVATLAFWLMPFMLLLFLGSYRLMWPELSVIQLQQQPSIWLMLALFLGGIMAHEGLHALGYWLLGRTPRTAVQVRFSRRFLVPVAGCRVPLTIEAYRLATLLPGLLLGILPGLLGIALGELWVTLFGELMMLAATTDLAILVALRHLATGTRILDHPGKAGCWVLED